VTSSDLIIPKAITTLIFPHFQSECLDAHLPEFTSMLRTLYLIILYCYIRGLLHCFLPSLCLYERGHHLMSTVLIKLREPWLVPPNYDARL